MKTEITNNPLTIEFPPLLNVPRQFFEIAAATTVVSTVLRIHFFYPLHAARHFASLERTHRVYLAISHFLTHSRKNTNLHEHPSATETRKTEEEEEKKKQRSSLEPRYGRPASRASFGFRGKKNFRRETRARTRTRGERHRRSQVHGPRDPWIVILAAKSRVVPRWIYARANDKQAANNTVHKHLPAGRRFASGPFLIRRDRASRTTLDLARWYRGHRAFQSPTHNRPFRAFARQKYPAASLVS